MDRNTKKWKNDNLKIEGDIIGEEEMFNQKFHKVKILKSSNKDYKIGKTMLVKKK